MKNIKFNFKLTVFLVSLFLGLGLVILGGKFKICLSFGFLVISASLVLYLWYDKEKSEHALIQIGEKINDYSVDEEMDEDERMYVIGELAKQQKSLGKRTKRLNFLFSVTALVLFVLSIINFF